MTKLFTLFGTSLIILLAFFVLSTGNATAQTITTGDANSFSCTINLVNTYSNYLSWFNTNCTTPTATPTPTVTPTPTPSPTIDPCANNACATPTPTATPAPTASPSTNTGGPGDGLGCGSHDCSGNVVGGGATPPTTQAVLGASTGPQVLGLSTTSGEENVLPQLIQILGALTSGGLGLFFFKKKCLKL